MSTDLGRAQNLLRMARLCMLLPALSLMASCNDSNDPPVEIALSREAIEVIPGGTRGITATVIGANPGEPVGWISSAPSIATVRGVGDSAIVTGVSIGSGSIYAVLASKPSVRSKAVPVVVSPPLPALVAVQVTRPVQTLSVGQSATFTPRIVRQNVTVDVSYTFASSAPNVVRVTRVEDDGQVTALAPGTATITITGTGSGPGYTTNVLSTSFTITVTPLSGQTTKIGAGLSHTVDSTAPQRVVEFPP